MLTVTDASVTYAGVPALSDVSLALAPGEVLAVLGPSGCGKSTLLRAIAGLEPLSSGRVAWDGRDLAGVPTHRRGFALLFQDGQLFGHRTVGANVAYPLRLAKGTGRTGRTGSRSADAIRHRRSRAVVEARVAELLALVGLSGFEDRMPGSLSGGERQRVALARALATSPRLLLLDEPLSALDQVLRERLAGDLRSILRAAGTTALLVTHDHEEAFAVADRMALLRAGRLVQQGTLSEVWEHPADAEAAAFLGYAAVLTGTAAARILAVLPEPTAHGGDSATDEHARPAGTGPAVALRRSALRVDPHGPLTGRVVEARLTPEATRLTVEIDGIGVLGAVADGVRTEAPAVGERVRLAVDVARLALVPIA